MLLGQLFGRIAVDYLKEPEYLLCMGQLVWALAQFADCPERAHAVTQAHLPCY